MRKKVYLALIGFIVTAATAITGQIITEGETPPSIEMKAVAQADVRYSNDESPVEIVFKNHGESPVRLLANAFDPELVDVFFRVMIYQEDGSPIGASGGGKVSFLRNFRRYIELKKDEEFRFKFNLKYFISKRKTLKPGNYRVAIKFANQYGENCFKGSVQTESIKLHQS